MLFTDAINLEVKEQLKKKKKKRPRSGGLLRRQRISVVNSMDVKSNGCELDFRVCVHLVSDLEQMT